MRRKLAHVLNFRQNLPPRRSRTTFSKIALPPRKKYAVTLLFLIHRSPPQPFVKWFEVKSSKPQNSRFLHRLSSNQPPLLEYVVEEEIEATHHQQLKQRKRGKEGTGEGVRE